MPKFNISIPDELVEEIQDVMNQHGLSKWVQQALRNRIEDRKRFLEQTDVDPKEVIARLKELKAQRLGDIKNRGKSALYKWCSTWPDDAELNHINSEYEALWFSYSDAPDQEGEFLLALLRTSLGMRIKELAAIDGVELLDPDRDDPTNEFRAWMKGFDEALYETKRALEDQGGKK